MPYTIDWFVENAVILETVEGTITLQDVQNQAIEIDTMVSASDRPLVHLLVDVGGMDQLPTSVRKMAAESNKLLKNPRLGWTVAYGTDKQILKFAGSLLFQIFHVRYRIFATQEEALAHLIQHDETLRPLLSEIN